MREALLLLMTIKWAQSIVDMGLKPHVKTEITLLELHDPEIPKTSSHSANGFGFPGTVCPSNNLLAHPVFFYNLGFGDNFLVGINQSSGGLLIGNALPRNSDREIVLSRATCSLRLFSCKTTKAKINVYFQRFEVRKEMEFKNS